MKEPAAEATRGCRSGDRIRRTPRSLPRIDRQGASTLTRRTHSKPRHPAGASFHESSTLPPMLAELEQLESDALAGLARRSSPMRTALEILADRLPRLEGPSQGDDATSEGCPARGEACCRQASQRGQDRSGSGLRRQAVRSACRGMSAGPAIDVTEPGLPGGGGCRHVLSRTIAEVAEVFARMGFEIAEGPRGRG